MNYTEGIPVPAISKADPSDMNSILVHLKAFALFVEGYVLILVMLTGTFGNILSIVVFCRNRKKDEATVPYLASLAISDTGCILFMGFTEWLARGLPYVSRGHLTFNIMTYSNVFCKGFRFLFQSCANFSAWTIVAFSAERTIMVWYPLKRTTLTNERRMTVLATLAVLALFSSIHTPVLIEVYQDFAVKNCYYKTNDVTRLVLWVSDNALYNYTPSFVILVLNTLIIVGISRSRETMKEQRTSQNEARERKTMISLMLVSTFYIVFMSPCAIFWIIYNGPLTFQDTDLVYMEIMFEVGKFLEAVTVLNYSMNFIIYGCSLPYYKREVTTMFCGCRK